MKIINNDNRYSLYWRVFNPDDGLCWVGLEEGFLKPKNDEPESTIYDHPKGRMKLEVRHNNLQGSPVLVVGPVYSNDTQITFQDNQITIEKYSNERGLSELGAVSIEIEKAMLRDPELEKSIINNIENIIQIKDKSFSIKNFSLDKEYYTYTGREISRGDEIIARAFWWGFHLDIPNQALSDIGVAIVAGASIAGIFGSITGPAAPFIAAAVTFVSAEYAWMKGVNRGNGIYLSMTWFAAGVFVPTAK